MLAELKFAEVCSRAEKPSGGVLTRADSARVLPGRSPASLARCSSGEASDTTVARRMRAAKLVYSTFQGKNYLRTFEGNTYKHAE